MHAPYFSQICSLLLIATDFVVVQVGCDDEDRRRQQISRYNKCKKYTFDSCYNIVLYLIHSASIQSLRIAVLSMICKLNYGDYSLSTRFRSTSTYLPFRISILLYDDSLSMLFDLWFYLLLDLFRKNRNAKIRKELDHMVWSHVG